MLTTAVQGISALLEFFTYYEDPVHTGSLLALCLGIFISIQLIVMVGFI